MKDVNKALRTAYYNVLLNTNEAVYSNQAPDDAPANYIVFSTISGAPVPTLNGTSLEVTIQVRICTEAEVTNDGDMADDIAHKVYQQILPDPTRVLSLSGSLQMVSTSLVNDTGSEPFTLKNQVIAIDRTITFRHLIYIRS